MTLAGTWVHAQSSATPGTLWTACTLECTPIWGSTNTNSPKDTSLLPKRVKSKHPNSNVKPKGLFQPTYPHAISSSRVQVSGSCKQHVM